MSSDDDEMMAMGIEESIDVPNVHSFLPHGDSRRREKEKGCGE